ncbi:MAG: AmmeMemoRadiSam system radical SAM enzyme [Candidatus Omnitrophota bacterium]
MIKEAMLYEKLSDGLVRCCLCAHYCVIDLSEKGFCRVRQNIKGILKTLTYAEAAAVHIDPIEKKPLYHFFPGTLTYSIASRGCNFKCGFCQNWQISQISNVVAPFMEQRMSFSTNELGSYTQPELIPEDIVQETKRNNLESISYTYTEPTVFFEYAYDTAKLAKQQGIKNIFVTNGYMTKQALEAINPYLDAANVDLKSFREEFYLKNCQAHLAPVLETIKLMKKMGIWLEITTLVIPGENDSESELKGIAGFIAGIDKEIPWHISKFSPCYEFTNYEPTPIETLQKAYNIGKEQGLLHVYLGNV